MILVLRAYFLLVPMGLFGISPELSFDRAIENMTISLAVLITEISPNGCLQFHYKQHNSEILLLDLAIPKMS